MSRSNPNDITRNPSARWYEWAGGSDGGAVRYYDKESKSNLIEKLPFIFIPLDELATVRGWHDPSESGIYCNEVRDTRQDTFVVKAFKGGELASGLYAQIRDRIKAVGGHFQSSNYIAFKDGTALALGNISFKGAALNAWVEFKNAHRAEIYKQAVAITGYKDAKKGATAYRIPVFALRHVAPETDAAAIELDKELQTYLAGYLSRPKDEQTTSVAKDQRGTEPAPASNREELDERMADQYQAAGDPFDDELPPF